MFSPAEGTRYWAYANWNAIRFRRSGRSSIRFRSIIRSSVWKTCSGSRGQVFMVPSAADAYSTISRRRAASLPASTCRPRPRSYEKTTSQVPNTCSARNSAKLQNANSVPRRHAIRSCTLPCSTNRHTLPEKYSSASSLAHGGYQAGISGLRACPGTVVGSGSEAGGSTGRLSRKGEKTSITDYQ